MKLAAGRRRAAGSPRPHRHARMLGWSRAALVAVAVLALDRITKQAVESSIRQGEERSFLPGVQLVHTRNNGVAFGLLGGAQVYLTVALALAVVLVLIYFARRASHGLIWLPTGMILGGALGNVIDRLRFGSVTDFVKLPLGWPPFNLADAAITIGVLLLALMVGRPRPGERAPG